MYLPLASYVQSELKITKDDFTDFAKSIKKILKHLHKDYGLRWWKTKYAHLSLEHDVKDLLVKCHCNPTQLALDKITKEIIIWEKTRYRNNRFVF